MSEQWVRLPLADLQYIESALRLAEAQPDVKPTVREAALRAMTVLRRNYQHAEAPCECVQATVPAYDSQTITEATV